MYQSQMPVKLESDRSCGYCLEMISADFLAGGNRDNGDSETLLFSMSRFFKYLPERSGWRSWKAWGSKRHELDWPQPVP